MRFNLHGEDQAWLEYKKKFSDIYDETNYSRGLQGWVMNRGHALLESPWGSEHYFKKILEVGGGTGTHFSFVRHQFDIYILTDKEISLLQKARKRVRDKRLICEAHDASRLGFRDDAFDRLIASHVLEHLERPHLVIKEWIRVVKNGGIISLLLPTDPGLAWRVARMFGPRRKAKKIGLPYDYIMAREHINSSHNLLAILRYYFPYLKVIWWPCRVPSVDINIFLAIHIEVTK